MELFEINTVNQLHTEKLIQKYGNINISLIKHNGDSNLRLSELKDEDGVLRTYAITIFSSVPYSDILTDINRSVKNGSSIGQTIKDFGCGIAKKTIANFIIDTPNFFNDYHKFTSCNLSEIYCKTDGGYEYYAEICEILCPSFKLHDSINEYENKSITEKIKNVLSLGDIYPENIILIK